MRKIIALAFILTVTSAQAVVVAYDCRLAEISPDYPQAVKIKCRQLIADAHREKQKKQQKPDSNANLHTR